MPNIDPLDRAIIEATQAGLPLVAEPYRQVAERLGIDEALLLQRLERMQQAGIIRRIAAVPHHYRLGFVANGMSVWDIPDPLRDEAGELLAGLDWVSHCYARPRRLPLWPYNLFAMVHGRDRDEVFARVAEMVELLGSRVARYDILFSTRVLKKTGLRLRAPATGRTPSCSVSAAS